MIRTFIQTTIFESNWSALGFNDDDLHRLELTLLLNPKSGAVIRGTGKLRKLRFATANSGKSGGVRICYVDFERYKTIYLITAYAKSEKENLSKAERNSIKTMIDQLETTL